MKGHLKVRLGPIFKNLISQSLVSFASKLPSEVSRSLWPLHEFEHFKATVFRTLLLYTGVVAFKNHL